MKAQKAAIISAAAVVLSLAAAPAQQVSAAGEQPVAVISVTSAAADTEGHFETEICLDELPETGLSALEFAVSYDPAALSITDAELLYDTGAQKAEILAHVERDGMVFTEEKSEGLLRIRWGTAMDSDYWLKDACPFVRISGTTADSMQPGARTELEIVPAPIMTADGTEIPGTAIAAGYHDSKNRIYPVTVSVKKGLVWKPSDETGATVYGDLNLDGAVTLADAVMLHQAVAERLALSAAAYANADCEADDVLTIGDVTLMLRVLEGELDAVALGRR